MASSKSFTILLLLVVMASCLYLTDAGLFPPRKAGWEDFQAGQNTALKTFLIYDSCVPAFYTNYTLLLDCVRTRYQNEFDPNIVGILQGPGSPPTVVYGFNAVTDLMAQVGTENKGEMHTFGAMSQVQTYPQNSEYFCAGDCYAGGDNPFTGWSYMKFFSGGTSMVKDLDTANFTNYLSDYTWIIKSILCLDGSRRTRISALTIRIKAILEAPQSVEIYDPPAYTEIFKNRCP